MACDSVLWSDVVFGFSIAKSGATESAMWPAMAGQRLVCSSRLGSWNSHVADGMTVGHPCLGNFLPQCCGEAGEGLAGGDLLHLEASLLTVAVAAVLLGADATVHTYIGTHKHHDDKTRINP